MKPFQELVSRYFENELTEKEVSHLQELLRDDLDRQAEFMAAAELHGRLKWEYAQRAEMESTTNRSAVVSADPATRRAKPTRRVLALAAAIVIGAIATKLLIPDSSRPATNAADILANQMAKGRVVHSDEGFWGDSIDREIEIGEWLQPKRYFLKSGTVTIALDVGGVALIEGPSEFEIPAADRIKLFSGSIQARFEEPGQGFIVDTPNGQVVDLGTEFRIRIGESASEVEVVEGRVRIDRSGSESRELTTRESMRITQSGITEQDSSLIQPMASRFTYQNAVAAYHWNFEGDDPDWFPGTSTDGSGKDYAFRPGGSGKPPQRIEGVIGKALRFSGEGEYVLSSYKGVPGNKPRTVAAWIRIPKDVELKHAYGWAGWGYESYRGGHMDHRKWQLSWNPQVRMANWTQPLTEGSTVGAIRTEFGPGWVNGTQDLRDGKWHHLVSIFIGGENADVATHIRHYVDGRLEPASGYQHHNVETLIDEEESLSLMMGEHMWTPIWAEQFENDTGNEHRPFFSGFRGDVDELHIFEGALTPLQVWRLYKENQAPAPDEISPSIGTIDS